MSILRRVKCSVSEKAPSKGKVAAVSLIIIAVLCAVRLGFTQQSDTITYTYDKLNRLTGVIYTSGPSIIYTYDAAGNRTSVQVTGANSIPVIISINPSNAKAGTTGITLTVNGSNFFSNSIVQWNGANRST